MIELKNCPFCGEKPRWCGADHDSPESDHDCHNIVCDGCHTFFDVDSFEAKNTETLEELRAVVAKGWNSRV